MALFLTFSLTAQDSSDETGLTGDNFSLEGALEMFKTAQSLEDFEKKINSESNHINNLDLNEDGEIDYVTVIDNMEGDLHAIVLQVPVNAEEAQDIAVIEIEKTGKETAILQIVGDETLYGENHFVEPYNTVKEGGGKGGPNFDADIKRVVFNVWVWPCVPVLFAPAYRPYHSPWRWAYYPRWWTPWRPVTVSVFRPRIVRYRPGFRVVTTHRVVRAHKVYVPRRRTSKVVASRTVVKKQNGKTVAKKTTVTKAGKAGPNGKKAGVSRTTTTAVKGKNGKTAVRQKNTKAGVKKRGNTVTGKKSTTVKRKGRNGAVGGKKTTVKKKRRN